MQALWNPPCPPLANEYFSCGPYLLGEGQAMQYSFHPLTKVPTRIARLRGARPTITFATIWRRRSAGGSQVRNGG